MVQVRVITTNAAGNDEWVGVDDINVTGAPPGPSGTGNANPNPVVAGNSTLLTVATTQGNPPSPIVSVVADLTAIGGSPAQPFADDGTGGDVTAGDGIYSYLAAVPSNTTGGTKLLPATITDALARTGTVQHLARRAGVDHPALRRGRGEPLDRGRGRGHDADGGGDARYRSPEHRASWSSATSPPSAAPARSSSSTTGPTATPPRATTCSRSSPPSTPPPRPGAKTLPATITDDQARTGNASIALTVTAAVVPSVVISQIYGRGRQHRRHVQRNDFVELFNPSTTAADLSGWSVQYASATGSTWQVTPLSGLLGPGRYFLVQEAPAANGANLPAPDATGTIAMSATAGKVLLVRTAAAQTGSCPSGPLLRDLVGYGSTADCFEGAGPALAGTVTRSTAAPDQRLHGERQQRRRLQHRLSSRHGNTSSAPTDCTAPPPTAPLFAINAIQGSGSASPLNGQVVRARGIVTGRTSNTYFIQTPDGDAADDNNPSTSEGLIVFTGGTPTVTAGQFVETTGTVTEFIPGADLPSPPKTEITPAGRHRVLQRQPAARAGDDHRRGHRPRRLHRAAREVRGHARAGRHADRRRPQRRAT